MARVTVAPAITDVDYLEGLLEHAEETFAAADGVARVQALRLMRDLKAELDAARAFEASRATNNDVTTAEFSRVWVACLREVSTPDLESAVREYLSRHPGMRLVAE